MKTSYICAFFLSFLTLEASAQDSKKNLNFKEHPFISCIQNRKFRNHEIIETLDINIVTNQKNFPVVIQGEFKSFNTAYGKTETIFLTGKISGKYFDSELGFYFLELQDGIAATNTEGYFFQDQLFNVGFSESKTFASYATSNDFISERYLKGCQILNLHLYHLVQN